MMIVAAIIGAVSSVVGLYLSFYLSVASGAAVVLTAPSIFLLAFLFAPARGLVPRRWHVQHEGKNGVMRTTAWLRHVVHSAPFASRGTGLSPLSTTSRVIGTMPGEESLRRQEEHYGHPRNQFWRILADLFTRRWPRPIQNVWLYCARGGWRCGMCCSIVNVKAVSISDS